MDLFLFKMGTFSAKNWYKISVDVISCFVEIFCEKEKVKYKGGQFLFICVLFMFLIRVFQNERFSRFLQFLASLTNNNGTVRKCYVFSYRYKNV